MKQTLIGSETPEPTPNSTRMNAFNTTCFVVSVLAVLTCVCGLVGNSLVICMIRMKRSPFCVYVLNLAVADLLFLLCMASVISLDIIFLARNTKVCEVVRRVKYFAYTVDLSLLTAISTQRCLSVLFPIWYKVHRPQRLSTVVCTLLWTLSLLMSIVASYFCTHFRGYDKQQCFTVDVIVNIFIFGTLTPMILSSMVLFIKVQRSSRQWCRQSPRLLLVILASVLMFLVCSLPLGVYSSILYWVDLPQQLKILYVSISCLSSSLGCSANPIIYFLVGRWRRQRLQEPLGAVLSRALQEEPIIVGKETPSTGTNEVGPESQDPTVPVHTNPVMGLA
ncbi:mas-related G-protein coupled receptor member D [Orycteropus afer afer]|uniref:Mas-related G-protein coupled receptor member D n=1 Tax=Orycteropus afer afer TaxID=1230840 RepID=A0A8B7A585_ORYAF|nr:mas-related G-protein coupled receptor member D [Orycteropus afer afer]